MMSGGNILGLLGLLAIVFVPAFLVAAPILGMEAGRHKDGLRGVLRDAFKD